MSKNKILSNDLKITNHKSNYNYIEAINKYGSSKYHRKTFGICKIK